MDVLLDVLAINAAQWQLLLMTALLAGAVRGFTGFGLSAIMMACAAGQLAPIELIPICFLLELTASLVMLRGGWREADRRLAVTVAAASAVGWPLGLWITTHSDPRTSALLALSAIALLSVGQLLAWRPQWIQRQRGVLGAGVVAGVVSGVAHAGGMVVALTVLARGLASAQMRATLVLQLAIGSITGAIAQLSFGVLNETALWRGFSLLPVMLIGIAIGSWFFDPQRQVLYKRFTLGLLIALCAVGAWRQLS